MSEDQEDVWPVTEEEAKEMREAYHRLPPHKRNRKTLYRSWFWHLQGLQNKLDKTQDDKLEIIRAKTECDKLWGAMTLAEQRDIDPLLEVTNRGSLPWDEVKVLRCPHCGWVHYVSKSSDGPPRCAACMLDINVPLPKRFVVKAVAMIQGRGQVASFEMGDRKIETGEHYSVIRKKQILGKVVCKGVEYSTGLGTGYGALLQGVSLQENDELVRTTE